METKIGTSFQLRSSFSDGSISNLKRNKYTDSAKNIDIFEMSSSQPAYCSQSEELREKLREFTKEVKNAVPLNFKCYKSEANSPKSKTKMNFEVLSDLTTPLKENFASSLEEAEIPKDITFEFDYDINTDTAAITKISDEAYREKAETVLNGYRLGLSFTAFASRVMNGYISSAYYPAIAKNLESCYGQDIADLYIDEKGNLCGANENLQKAIKASKRGEEFVPDPHHIFPAKNIEGIIKRLVSDENITPNISHMGYDGESIYTNDGEFKFGKDFDPNLFGEEKYAMRGSVSLLINNGYDRWLENEEKFY